MDKQWSTNHCTNNQRASNMNLTKYRGEIISYFGWIAVALPVVTRVVLLKDIDAICPGNCVRHLYSWLRQITLKKDMNAQKNKWERRRTDYENRHCSYIWRFSYVCVIVWEIIIMTLPLRWHYTTYKSYRMPVIKSIQKLHVIYYWGESVNFYIFERARIFVCGLWITIKITFWISMIKYYNIRAPIRMSIVLPFTSFFSVEDLSREVLSSVVNTVTENIRLVRKISQTFTPPFKFSTTMKGKK